MSRDVKFDDPSTWKDDDDLEYVRQRIDRVPPDLRVKLKVDVPVFAPGAVAESPELMRLRTFLELNFPDEWATGETPVGLAIRLLTENTDAEESVDEVQPTAPDYDKWKAAELVAEIENRRAAGRDIPGDKFSKAEAAAALRADDQK